RDFSRQGLIPLHPPQSLLMSPIFKVGLREVSAHFPYTTTGALTSTGSAVSTGTTAASSGPAALVTVLSKFLYSANDGCPPSNVNPPPPCSPGSVSAFSINASTGALTTISGSPFTAGVNPNSIVA